MPTYDVKCFKCGYVGLTTLKIAELNLWDQSAQCPDCQESHTYFKRVIRSAPTNTVLARPKANLTSGDKDDMKHEMLKRKNPDQIASAIEHVRKGTYEGF